MAEGEENPPPLLGMGGGKCRGRGKAKAGRGATPGRSYTPQQVRHATQRDGPERPPQHSQLSDTSTTALPIPALAPSAAVVVLFPRRLLMLSHSFNIPSLPRHPQSHRKLTKAVRSEAGGCRGPWEIPAGCRATG